VAPDAGGGGAEDGAAFREGEPTRGESRAEAFEEHGAPAEVAAEEQRAAIALDDLENEHLVADSEVVVGEEDLEDGEGAVVEGSLGDKRFAAAGEQAADGERPLLFQRGDEVGERIEPVPEAGGECPGPDGIGEVEECQGVPPRSMYGQYRGAGEAAPAVAIRVRRA
jgi:hypothetical protein